MRGFLVGLCLLGSGAASSTELELEPAWSGWIGTAAGSTEIRVRVRSAAASWPARLEVIAGAQRVATRLDAGGGASSSLSLLVPTASELTVQLVVADGRATSASQPMHVAERPLVAHVSGPPRAGAAAERDPAPPDDDLPLSLVDLPPTALPRLAGAYSNVAGLAIDASALPLLDADQTAALLEHLRACGFTFLSGASSAVLAALRQSAGCGGRDVVAGGEWFDPEALRAAFVARAVMQPLDAAGVGQLAGADRRLSGSMVALAAYLILVAAALVFPARRRWWLGSLLAGSIAVALVLAGASQRRALIVWSEAMSGDRTASYLARLRAAPLLRGSVTMALPSLLGDPARCDPRDTLVLVWSAPQRQFTSVAVGGRLFADPEVCFHGSFPIAQAARLEPLGNGQSSLKNLGPGAWQSAALIWHGSVYELAPLAAGGTCTIGPSAGRAPRTAGERMAINRTPWSDPALLLPLGLDAMAGAAGATAGWLLLAVPADEARAT